MSQVTTVRPVSLGTAGATVSGVSARLWQMAAAISDPQHPWMSIGASGVLTDLNVDDRGRAHVRLALSDPEGSLADELAERLVDLLSCEGCLCVRVEVTLG